MLKVAPFFVVCLMAFPTNSSAQDGDAIVKQMGAAVEFSKELCVPISTEGGTMKSELEGQGDFGLSIFSKKLADLGIEGAAKLNVEEFKNVIQSELPDLISSTRDCRTKMYMLTLERLSQDLASKFENVTAFSESEKAQISLVSGDDAFSMVPGDVFSIGSPDVTFSLDGIDLMSGGRGRISYTWSNISTEEADTNVAKQANIIKIGQSCKLVVTSIDPREDIALFLAKC